MATPDIRWMADAACRGTSLDLWFPSSADRRRLWAAKQVCRDCRVREDCERYAETLNIDFGVWGGRGEFERRQQRKANR